MSTRDVLELIDEMLKNAELLTALELSWVERIDESLAEREMVHVTERQEEVIRDIYRRYSSRSGGE